jgi:[acyl-carrier-protein] S-malonyltransferase
MTHRIAVLFPGQASQQVGMGRLAAARFVAARRVFERVDEALAAPISALCFEGSAERLQETRWQQPAVFACSLALLAAWQASGAYETSLVGAAGHSLGEFGALVLAGSLTLEDAARLVGVRGTVMQEAADRHPGGMAAVLGLDRDTVAAICAETSQPEAGNQEIVVLANDNAPDQQVISGGLAALARAGALARARGARRVVPLKVAGAFHAPLMAEAAARVAQALETTPIGPCRFPVIANSTGEIVRDAAAVRAELARQIMAPVRWVESVQTLATLAPDLWVDTGPGAVVAGLARRVLPSLETLTLSTSFDVPEAV